MAKLRSVRSSVRRLWDESKHPRDAYGRFARVRAEKRAGFDAAKRRADSLGVDIKYGKGATVAIANVVNEGLASVKKDDGLVLPDKVVVDAKEFPRLLLPFTPSRKLLAAYAQDEKTVYINPSSYMMGKGTEKEIKARMANVAKQKRRAGWW
ncbi:MAG: hypothetical protein M3P49_11445, partial [Actinomycetota bacterium]|nr:hypothetical protein [Actinomycetota bacterium]